MAYDTKELEKIALDLIKQHGIPFISHLVSYMPCSRATFHNLGLNKLDSIEEALNSEKVSKKTILLNKMIESDNASCYSTAYKLLSDDYEFYKLSGQQIDHRSNGNELKSLTSDERQLRIAQLQKTVNAD